MIITMLIIFNTVIKWGPTPDGALPWMGPYPGLASWPGGHDNQTIGGLTASPSLPHPQVACYCRDYGPDKAWRQHGGAAVERMERCLAQTLAHPEVHDLLLTTEHRLQQQHCRTSPGGSGSVDDEVVEALMEACKHLRSKLRAAVQRPGREGGGGGPPGPYPLPDPDSDASVSGSRAFAAAAGRPEGVQVPGTSAPQGTAGPSGRREELTGVSERFWKQQLAVVQVGHSVATALLWFRWGVVPPR